MQAMTNADMATFEAAVARCAGELVAAILPRCAAWRFVRLISTAAATLIASLGVLLATDPNHGDDLLFGQVLFLTLFWWTSGFAPLLRRLVPKSAAAAAVVHRAQQLFVARGVHRMPHRTGLIIVISALEHQVAILGDTAIDAALGASGWQSHVQALIAGLRDGRPVEALTLTLAV